MLGSCRLNNKSMRNVRRTDAYQAIAIDLALLGIISKEECEMLLDGGIPSGIVLPDGSSKLTSEKNLPPKPDFIKVEPGDTETGDTEQIPILTGVTETGDTEQIPVLTGVTETGDTEQIPVQPEPTPVTVVSGDETQIPELIFGVSGDETGDTGIQPELIVGVDETQEPVNDEGRTESSN